MTAAVFPTVAPGRGHYESFYLRAVDPARPRAIWIRHTVHQRPGEPATAAVWCTVFGDGEPWAVKQSGLAPSLPDGSWIGVGDSVMGAGHARGGAEAAGHRAAWELEIAGGAPPLRHLPREWLYRAALPRTKLESPQPDAVFAGWVELDGERLEIAGWPGMTGHNWGAEHAATWVWLHGTAFDEAPGAWLDLALGRVRVGGVLTPWVANGALTIDGERHRLGGLHRRARVRAATGELVARVPGRGASAQVTAIAPRESTVGFRYADPGGDAQHDVLHCSVAELRLRVERPGRQALELVTPHGAAYELGLPEGTAGMPLQPYPDP
jgi:hypothetical protein